MSLRRRNVTEDITQLLIDKSIFKDRVRCFFREKGFIEIDTPYITKYPGLDPNIEVFELEFKGQRLFLHISPEITMKKILAGSNLKKIFQIARVFRKEPFIDELHNIEFDLVEFYMRGENYLKLIELSMDLLKFLSIVYNKREVTYRGNRAIIGDSYEVVSLEEFIGKRKNKSLKDIEEEDFWLFFVEEIEPFISRIDVPVFLIDWPYFSSVMAKEKDDKPWLVERVELILAGVELMNGNTENIDPEKQLSRMLKEAKKRYQIEYEKYIDREFIDSIAKLGLTTGSAIGLDRLFMLFQGIEDIHKPYRNLI